MKTWLVISYAPLSRKVGTGLVVNTEIILWLFYVDYFFSFVPTFNKKSVFLVSNFSANSVSPGKSFPLRISIPVSYLVFSVEAVNKPAAASLTPVSGALSE